MFERQGYAAGYYPATDPEGRPRLLIVVKRSFTLDAVEAVCKDLEKPEPVLLADEYYGDENPFKSSVLVESDVAPWKLAADVIFVGKAHAPGGKKVPSFEASLRVGAHSRRLKLFGPRKATWVPPRDPKKKGDPPEPQPPVISEPEPIASVELIYENAYGGIATYYPPDPAAFRKAIRKAKKKAAAKEEAKKKEAEKQAEEAKAEAEKQAKKVAELQKKEALKKQFSSGEKRLEDAPDVELEVEMGSARHKTADGTVVLDLAELAEAQKRDEELSQVRVDKDAADALKRRRDQLEEKADEALLAKLAGEETAAAAAESVARQRLKQLAGDGGARFDLGDEEDEELDEDWVETERKKRDALYASLGLDPNEEIEWVEGDFPRIPCPSNFVGKGFALGNSKESLDGLELPLIEDAQAPLRPEDLPVEAGTLHLGAVPHPAGLGVVGRGWMPRSLQWGHLPGDLEAAQHALDKQLAEFSTEDADDQQALEALMERKPQKLDPRVYNCAAFQLPKLWGDEEVYLENLDKNGMTFFRLPGRRPLVRLDRGKGWEPVEVILDTLVIDRDKERVHLVWRGRVPYGGPKELEAYPRVDVDVQDFTVQSWRDELERQAIARREKRGEALVIGKDEVSAEESAAFESQIEQAGIGLHGVKEDRGPMDREARAADGALIDIVDRDDVIMSDDAWIAETQQKLLSDEEKKLIELQKDERKAVQAQKEKIRARLAEIKAEKQAAAEAEAKAKKKKKPKKDESKPADDDDADEAPPEPGKEGG